MASMHTVAHTPDQAIEILDRAFNEGDLDTIVSFYDKSAVVVPQPGIEARGLAAIRDMYADMLQPGMIVRQLTTHVLEADGIALFISRWSLSRPGEDEKTFISTTVLRQQADGQWKALIDNAQGPSILEERA